MNAHMNSYDAKLRSSRMAANYSIYSSIVLGAALLGELYYQVPLWLFYSVLAGWVAYVLVGIAATFSISIAYPSAIILAILTLSLHFHILDTTRLEQA